MSLKKVPQILLSWIYLPNANLLDDLNLTWRYLMMR
jgi:hypothetical protein